MIRAGSTQGSTASTRQREGILTERLATFAEERDWQQFHTPKNLAMALAGELIAEFQWLTPEQSTAVMSDPEAGDRVRAEIGDVMIYLARTRRCAGN